MATLKILRETESARRELTDDFNFVKNLTYFFELRVPLSEGSRVGSSDGVFFFPLILNPQAITVEEPFAVEVTPTQGGGLYVEENGIIQRILRIRGHTGFKPRRFAGAATVASVAVVEDKSHSRLLAPVVLSALSGQKHFQYLQDAVFRTYADLKRQPQTSEDTKLFFHNPKDTESWQVVPRKFALSRTAERRVLYEYDIELLIVGKADAVEASFSEDKDTLDKIRDGIATAKGFVDQATGFVRDVTASTAELTRLVKDASKVLGAVNATIDATTSLISGVTDLIEAPLASLNQITASLDSFANLFTTTLSEVRAIPDNYTNSWRRASQAYDRLGTHPELFETDAQRVLRDIRAQQEMTAAARRAQANADAGAASPGTIAGFAKTGTEPLLGDINRARAELLTGRGVQRYTAARQVTVAQGDTLSSLSAQYLGDARLWQDIAVLNGMKPPYLDTQADATLAGPDNPLPGVSGIGSKITVPSFGVAPQARPLLTTLGVSQEASYEEQVLGTDYRLEIDADRKGLFDWEIDVDGGSVDFRRVSGVANLGQAITTRLSTEKGSNVLYKRLGLQRVIGLTQTDVDAQLARFLVISAITSDPRIAGVQQLRFTNEGPDVLGVDAELIVRGFNQGTAVKAIGVGA